MNMSTILYGVSGLIIGSLLTLLVINNAAGNVGTNMMGFRIQNRTGSIDQHFIEQMVPHHEDAIVMAEVALEKSQRQEIRTLAENIIKTQTEENNQMSNWYRDWFGTEIPQDESVMGIHGMMGSPAMHMGMMGGDLDIENLRNSSDFDREFIEQMIPHHQMAIMMANMLKNSTDKAEMKILTDNIVSAQTTEINQMRQWYQEWGY